MSFITENSTITSFANYQDVVNMDERLFAKHEGISQYDIINFLKRSTDRILTKLKATDWWETVSGYSVLRPDLDKDKIIARQDDFSDMCVYFAMYTYILPRLSHFEEGSDGLNKIRYYRSLYNDIFEELLVDADWYDKDDDGTIEATEIHNQTLPNLHLER